MVLMLVRELRECQEHKQVINKSVYLALGVNLEGQFNWRKRQPNGRLLAPPHDATGHTWHHNDQHLFAITKFGTAAVVGGNYESDMQGYKDILADREILAVLAYIKSSWPKKIRVRHDDINRRAGR